MKTTPWNPERVEERPRRNLQPDIRTEKVGSTIRADAGC
jgi:hypothetical protein